ncbi:hypothetical protein U729_3118 (plasmid) [Clostridium baratii str. Sullivan]|uniref:Uncharacterized protein n=1 Tax=Clostridium baratii str. Sullivan TaxID=1415775 RepID=A0A0A7G2L8_9CLOT|nr:hypothetical protein [Clostridium baratii]AIY85275.1 hypothetical protein U729_3118 [Clostridium baratii str. Sullivan]
MIIKGSNLNFRKQCSSCVNHKKEYDKKPCSECIKIIGDSFIFFNFKSN